MGAGMHMSMGGGGGSGTSHGLISSGHGAVSILPDWLALIWAIAFLGVFAVHFRHLVDTRGRRRLWHATHVLMAVSMVFMFLPASILDPGIPVSFWQTAFTGGAAVILVWLLTEAIDRHPINGLWVVVIIDLVAMVYMWSSGAYRPALTWLLVVYFAVQTFLWATDRMRDADRVALHGDYTVAADGAVAAAAAAPLICSRDIRVSMCTMSLGMAYMLAAMQLLLG